MNISEYDNGAPIVTQFQDNVISSGSPITYAYLYQNGSGTLTLPDNAYGDGSNYLQRPHSVYS